jgi:hypothetical protein
VLSKPTPTEHVTPTKQPAKRSICASEKPVKGRNESVADRTVVGVLQWLYPANDRTPAARDFGFGSMEIDEAIDHAMPWVRLHPRIRIVEAFMDVRNFKILPPQNSSVANARGRKAGASARAARRLAVQMSVSGVG